jgi:hypothetical protein
MVRNVDPAQRFSPDVVDGAGPGREGLLIYLTLLGKSGQRGSAIPADEAGI